MHQGLKAALLTAAAISSWAAGPVRAQTLQEALAQTYNNNPNLLAARAQLRGVDEGVPQALAGWRPTVVMAGSYGAADTRTRSQVQQFRNDGSFFWRDPNFPQSTTIRQERSPATASITLSQPIYRGGRTTAQTRQAENLVLAQRARLLATEQQVLGDAVCRVVAV